MGNCLRHESAMVWAGDDWGSLEQKSSHNNSMHTDHGSMERFKLLGDQTESGSSSSSSSSSSHHEVKIKISKKELEQLMGRLRGAQGLSVEQVLLSQLINGGDQYDHDLQSQWEWDHQRSWKPVLQTIPEVN
ncbi:uncharacterized protein LOC133795124 [Humulus lupulus]|uniref:uncharacterized protein LOC133795124 n=1 Tax=Humulus lupulus TaxID=3486 RepID=UPI002B40174B|nr:uncharacterized protein LOC133795124 [Humulus lupulus]